MNKKLLVMLAILAGNLNLQASAGSATEAFAEAAASAARTAANLPWSTYINKLWYHEIDPYTPSLSDACSKNHWCNPRLDIPAHLNAAARKINQVNNDMHAHIQECTIERDPSKENDDAKNTWAKKQATHKKNEAYLQAIDTTINRQDKNIQNIARAKQIKYDEIRKQFDDRFSRDKTDFVQDKATFGTVVSALWLGYSWGKGSQSRFPGIALGCSMAALTAAITWKYAAHFKGMWEASKVTEPLVVDGSAGSGAGAGSGRGAAPAGHANTGTGFSFGHGTATASKR